MFLTEKLHATNINSSHFCFGYSVTHPILSTVSPDAHKHVLVYIPSMGLNAGTHEALHCQQTQPSLPSLCALVLGYTLVLT